MISWLAAAFLVAASLILLKVLGVVDNSLEVIRLSSHSASVFADKALSDRQKEKELQRVTLSLFKLFFFIMAGSAVALGIPTGLTWLFHSVGPGTWEDTLDTTLSWPFILASSLVGTAVYFAFIRKGSQDAGDV